MTEAHDYQKSQLLHLVSKVPEVTIYFWVIKIMATTVGETAADFLNDNLNLGLTKTTYIMTAALIIALVLQFRASGYVPALYWLVVVLISIVGTLVTDNLVENFNVSLWTTTILFSIALAAVFIAWYASEKTLSIHSVRTRKRESYYWAAILFTFALGTAAGDLVAEHLELGYWKSALLFGGIIAVVTVAHYVVKAYLGHEHRRQSSNAVLAFWIAYIVTRPLGASIGDLLSQSRHPDPEDPAAFPGLGLGTVKTSAIFLGAILLVVVYLTTSKKDQVIIDDEAEADSIPI